MKLYIKQKVFSLTSKFTVKDESGNDRYFVEGEFFSLRGRLHIMDAQGGEIGQIYRNIRSKTPRSGSRAISGRMNIRSMTATGTS